MICFTPDGKGTLPCNERADTAQLPLTGNIIQAIGHYYLEAQPAPDSFGALHVWLHGELDLRPSACHRPCTVSPLGMFVSD